MRHPKASNALGLLFLIAIFIALPTFTFRWWRTERLGQLTASEQLELLREAIAATENLDTTVAEEAWETLHRVRPHDPSVALNRALNRLLALDQLLAARTARMGLEGETTDTARQLEAQLASSRKAAEDYGSLIDGQATPEWIKRRIDLAEASAMQSSEANAIRQRAVESLSEAISSPANTTTDHRLLAGLLLQAWEQAETSIGDDDFLAREQIIVPLNLLADTVTDNLYFALRVAKSNVATKSPRSSLLIQRTRELSRAIEPTLRPLTEAIGLTPDELSQSIIDEIETENWSQASSQLNIWFNVLNGTDLVKSDRRRIHPHPLDRLSFSTLRELSSQVAEQQPIPSGESVVTFTHWATGPVQDLVAAAFIDVDIDLIPEVASLSAAGKLTLWKSQDDTLKTWDPIAQLDVDTDTTGLLVADLFMVDSADRHRIQMASSDTVKGPAPSARHTTVPALIVYGQHGVQLVSVDGRPGTPKDDRLKPLRTETGLEALTDVLAVAVGDLDGDGDLDLVVSTQELGVRLFVNRGNRTFFELEPIAPPTASEAPNKIVALTIADLDRDLDLDIVAVDGATGQLFWIENLLHLQFRYQALPSATTNLNATRLNVADFDGNVSWDILSGGRGHASLLQSHTSDAGTWSVEGSQEIQHNGSDFLVADWDNDSWKEMLIISDQGNQAKRIWGENEPDPVEVSLAPVSKLFEAMDFDSDGRIDLLAAGDNGWELHRNVTEPVGHHLAARLRGIDDNHPASGRINHYAIGSVLELRFGPHYRAEIITSPSTHFGLDGFTEAASLRAIFPNGLTQTIRNPPIDTVVEEEQTLKGSCPYLYSWDGEQFVFVTDCLWAAPLGLQLAWNVVAQDRPWEYLKLDGDLVRPRNDTYELRITEELWEIAYIDHIALTAVDHPDDVEVWTNEKVGPPDVATPQLHAFRKSDVLPVRHAVDTRGQDVTALLRDVDGKHVQGFERRFRQGLCPPHWIDMDFGNLPVHHNHGRVLLVMTGWILPTDSSLNIQIDQNPDLTAIQFPSVWVPDPQASDGWREAIPYTGFPGGKSKTIVIDVSDSIRYDDPRLRIRTSAEIYWDSASLVVMTDQPEVIQHELKLQSAELRYRGFSAKYRQSLTSPERYNYALVRREPLWPPLRGSFSNYGNCLPTLLRWDDRMIVMAPGDEIRLCFQVPMTDPPTGWKRDFVLHCVGWDKDADLNTLAGQSSDPLPFRRMKSYPPLPDQAEEARQVEELNRNRRQRTQSFRQFWSR